jgi:hypothetical protein
VTEPSRERLRIYVDTSVLGGCFEPKFSTPSLQLVERFRRGHDILVVSTVLLGELREAPEPVRTVLNEVPERWIERLGMSADAERLAGLYLAAGVLPRRMKADAEHIAVATVAEVDVLVSWNFKHVVNLRRIEGYNAVNLGLGYPPLKIRTPHGVLEDGD